MNALNYVVASVVVGMVLFTSGCASVVSGRHADVAFNCNVPGAHVTIRDSDGYVVSNTMTPGKVALKRKNGWLFPAKYTATFSAPGYESKKVVLRQKVNPWVLGNAGFLYAGVITLAIDSATGAAWSPRNPNVYQTLAAVDDGALEFPTVAHAPDTHVQPTSGKILRR